MSEETGNMVAQLHDASTIIEGVADDIERGNRKTEELCVDLEVVETSLVEIRQKLEATIQ